MSSQQSIPSGPGSKVFVSQGAEAFDPDSLLDSPTEAPSETPPPQQRTLVILNFTPPLGDQVQVAGILSSLSTNKSGFQVQFVCLTEVAIELVQLSMGNDTTSLDGCDLVTSSGKEISKLVLPNLILSKVRVRNLSDNRAEVKVQVRYP